MVGEFRTRCADSADGVCSAATFPPHFTWSPNWIPPRVPTSLASTRMASLACRSGAPSSRRHVMQRRNWVASTFAPSPCPPTSSCPSGGTSSLPVASWTPVAPPLRSSSSIASHRSSSSVAHWRHLTRVRAVSTSRSSGAKASFAWPCGTGARWSPSIHLERTSCSIRSHEMIHPAVSAAASCGSSAPWASVSLSSRAVASSNMTWG
mmetsp:Transcript_13695/g.43775  ORF Transcript_13695/g.43775 Transcript_13695/m.43775 type:complete len:207 (+) Transcript_13695:235-855(+)